MKITKRKRNTSQFIRLMLMSLMVATLSLAMRPAEIQNDAKSVLVKFRINKAEPEKSVIYVAIYKDADTFLDENAYFKNVEIDSQGNATVSGTIELPSGTYAMAIFQDLNANGEMDSNLVGIPREPFGFSNNAKGNFGPPSWVDAKIVIDESAEVSIDLKTL